MFIFLTKQPPYRYPATEGQACISLKSTSLGCSVFLGGGLVWVTKRHKSVESCVPLWQLRHGVGRPHPRASVVALGVRTTQVGNSCAHGFVPSRCKKEPHRAAAGRADAPARS